MGLQAEHLVFDNIENVWDDNPAGTPGNETSAHLIASDAVKRIGTAIMLRTMPGDEFRISADCFYAGQHGNACRYCELADQRATRWRNLYRRAGIGDAAERSHHQPGDE